jgi:hypothetical protein
MQLVDLAVRMVVDDPGEDVGEVGRVDVVQLAGFGRDSGPMLAPPSEPANNAFFRLSALPPVSEASLTAEAAFPGGQPMHGGPSQDPPPALVRPKEGRKRNKAHLLFVSGQPCLICKKSPSDAHHLKFAQARALGRKVSDEFTVPLCRAHHQDVHRHGNERTWWANMQIAPLPVAEELWQNSTANLGLSAANNAPNRPEAGLPGTEPPAWLEPA